MSKLSYRLKFLLNCVQKSGIICDVGCDHGLVGIECLNSNKADKVIFIDISQASLKKAIINAKDARVIDKSQFICQDGLHNIYSECAIISGMGGMEIISILSRAEYLPEILVLQPMKNAYDLRKFLLNNYKITLDIILHDGKFYNFICANKGYDNYSELELKYGRTNLLQMPEDFILYLHKQLKTNKNIYNLSKDQTVNQTIYEIQQILSNYKQ